jgi:hypothetical protein
LWLPLSCAVAFAGSFTDPGFSTSTTQTFSYNATGVDFLFVFVRNISGQNISTITFDTSVSLSAITTGNSVSFGPHRMEFWGAVVPSGNRGTHDVVITLAGANGFAIYTMAWGYSGAHQTDAIGAAPAVQEEVVGSPAADAAFEITTTETDAWIVAAGLGSGGTVSQGTGATLRGTSTSYSGMAAVDSGAVVSAGANAINLTNSSGGTYLDAVLAELIPAGGGGGGTVIPVLMNLYRQYRH